MSAVPSDAAPETVHCDTCNSDIKPRNFLKVTWTGDPGPACPNCNSLIGSATAADEASSAEVDAFLTRTGTYCTHCGGALPPATADRLNYCPRCGQPVEGSLDQVQWRDPRQTTE